MKSYPDKDYPFISIIVIVYNMRRTIQRCLDSLFTLNYPSDRYEVIVVDGGSTDGTQAIVQNYDVRLLIEKKKVRGYARNLGIKHAKGQIIAFIDADCSADSDWLNMHVKNYADNPDLGAVGGSINQFLNNTLYVWPDCACSIVAMEDGEYLSSSPKRYVSVIPTCNSSFKKEVFTRIGMFDERLHVAEDTEMCYRILKNNYKILFDPKAEIMHYDHYHFTEFKNFNNNHFSKQAHLFIERFFNGGKFHYRLQRIQEPTSYRLPMYSLLIFVLYFGIVGIRILRNFSKLRYLNRKRRLIDYIPYVILASISWVSGYLFESLQKSTEN